MFASQALPPADRVRVRSVCGRATFPAVAVRDAGVADGAGVVVVTVMVSVACVPPQPASANAAIAIAPTHASLLLM
jgi:hypothetical protein